MKIEKVRVYKLAVDLKDYIKDTDKVFGAPDYEMSELEISKDNPQHKGILTNFVNAILHNEPLIAPGKEGILGLTISMLCIYHSGLTAG